MKLDDVIAGARALQLSDRAIEAVILSPDPRRALAEMREIVELCAFAKRPELANEYRDILALRRRLCNDRAAADEELNIDTSGPLQGQKSAWDARKAG